MKHLPLLFVLLSFSACAHLPMRDTAGPQRAALWEEAHQALAAGLFDAAEQTFGRLAREHSDSREGQESVFYLGALRLDPRNPAWDPQPAESHLRAYLERDTVQHQVVHRRPEAMTLLQLAQQLNMPGEERVPGLQPETRVVVREGQRVVVPAAQSRELAGEVERLRRELAQRDEQIRNQRDELERIRKTLTPRR